MPAVVKVDRVGVPEVGQYTDRCPPQVVAGRIVFAQLIPGVERASDAVPVVVGALSGVFDAGGGDGSVRVANNASIAFDRPIHDLGASAVSRSMLRLRRCLPGESLQSWLMLLRFTANGNLFVTCQPRPL